MNYEAAHKKAKSLTNGETFCTFVSVLRELGITRYDGPLLFQVANGNVSIDLPASARTPEADEAELAVALASTAAIDAKPEPKAEEEEKRGPDGLTKKESDELYFSSPR